jgi:hypothetical protein
VTGTITARTSWGVQREVGVQRIDAPRHQRRDLPGALCTDTGGSNRPEALHEGGSQLLLGESRGPAGGQFSSPGQRCAHTHDHEQRREWYPQLTEVLTGEGTRDHMGEEPRLGDDQQRVDGPDLDQSADERSRRARVVQQPRVDETRRARSAAWWCATHGANSNRRLITSHGWDDVRSAGRQRWCLHPDLHWSPGLPRRSG